MHYGAVKSVCPSFSLSVCFVLFKHLTDLKKYVRMVPNDPETYSFRFIPKYPLPFQLINTNGFILLVFDCCFRFPIFLRFISFFWPSKKKKKKLMLHTSPLAHVAIYFIIVSNAAFVQPSEIPFEC